MPAWFTNMTTEDMERNHREWREEERRRARRLRTAAREAMDEAARIDDALGNQTPPRQ